MEYIPNENRMSIPKELLDLAINTDEKPVKLFILYESESVYRFTVKVEDGDMVLGRTQIDNKGRFFFPKKIFNREKMERGFFYVQGGVLKFKVR